MAINANSHPYKVVVGDGTSPIYANRHPIKVEIEGGVVTPAEFEELEKKVDALATDLSYKGGVPTYDDLPADPEQGDVYTVEDTGVLWVWDGTQWVALNDTSSNTIVATTAPTTSTEGEVGQFYVDTTTGKVYVLTAISGNTYTWQRVGGQEVKTLSWHEPNYIRNQGLPSEKKYIAPAKLEDGLYYLPEINTGRDAANDAVGVTFGFAGGDDISTEDISGLRWSRMFIKKDGSWVYIMPYNTGQCYAAWSVHDTQYDIVECWNAIPDKQDVTCEDLRIIRDGDLVVEFPDFSGATAQSNGKRGLVPRPTAGQQNAILSGNGQWVSWHNSDYEESDTTSPAYIQHRPFYDESTTSKTLISSSTYWSGGYYDPSYDAGFFEALGDYFVNFSPSAMWDYRGAYIQNSSTGGQVLYDAISNATVGDGFGIEMQLVKFDMMSEQEQYILLNFDEPLVVETVTTSQGDINIAKGMIKYSWDNGVTWDTAKAALYASSESSATMFAWDFDPYSTENVNPDGNVQSRAYSVTMVTNFKQLDAKYVPVDNSTITVNGQGKLVANGVIKTLTAADYNYPTTGTADRICPWLLNPGYYWVKAGTTVSRFDSYGNHSSTNLAEGGFILVGNAHYITGSNQADRAVFWSDGSTVEGGEVHYNTETGAALMSRSVASKGEILNAGWVSNSAGNQASLVITQQAATQLIYPSGYENSKNRVRIGDSSQASHNHSVALGDYAQTSAQGEVNVGTGSQNYGYNSSNYRLLSGVYDGQSAHDAATVGQLPATLTISQFNSILETA